MTSLTTVLNTMDITDIIREPIRPSYISYYPYRRVEPKQVVSTDPAPGKFRPNPALGDDGHKKHSQIMDAIKGLTLKQNVSQKVGEGDAAQRVEQVLKSDRTWRNY